MPTVDYVRNAILDPFLNGDLIPKAKDDLAVEMTKLRLEKIKTEIEYLKLKNRYMENFGSPMSASATRMIKPKIINESSKTEWVTCSEPKEKYQCRRMTKKIIGCNVSIAGSFLRGRITNHIIIKLVEFSTPFNKQTRAAI